MKGIMDPSSSGVVSSKIEGMVSGQQDIMWGNIQAEIKVKLQKSSSNPNDANNDDEYDDGNDDNFVYNDDDYEDVDPAVSASDGIQEHQVVDTNILDVQGGLQIRVDGMLHATRKVKKINIGYSTISKRVNV